MSNDIIREQRLTNLRNALNTELKRRNVSQTTFVQPTVNLTPVKSTDITSIREGIDRVKPASYTDKIVANETVIKEVHFSELEDMVTKLSSHPVNGGTTDCAGGCTGMCVSCSGDCTGSCSGCSGSCDGCRSTCSLSVTAT